LIGFVVGGFFLSLAYSEILYTLIALAVSVQKLDRLGLGGPEAPRRYAAFPRVARP
jgi:hypothetical protein